MENMCTSGIAITPSMPYIYIYDATGFLCHCTNYSLCSMNSGEIDGVGDITKPKNLPRCHLGVIIYFHGRYILNVWQGT